VAALLNEQVPDGDPNVFIQQLGSGVHHPDRQRDGDHCAPLPESMENHHVKVKARLKPKNRLNARKQLEQEEGIHSVNGEVATNQQVKTTHLPIGMEGPIGP
jgi:hypothetical protein